MSISDQDAGAVLLAVSAAAWIFYAVSRAYDEYRHRISRRAPRLNVRVRP